MNADTIELVERVRRHLTERENPVQIAGPVSEAQILAAEEALGVTFPPSYRTFLRTFGGLAIPPHLGVVHDFMGVVSRPAPPINGSSELPIEASIGTIEVQPVAAPAPGSYDVVQRTLSARTERKLAENLVVVGMGAQYQEWFCLDASRPDSEGEYPVLLFDARDNALDQQFYDDFGQMLSEVMGFVADSLDQPLD